MKLSNKYDHYYNYAEITEILKGYASNYPDKIRLTSIGTSDEGREIWMAEMTDTASGDYDSKPGFYVAGHFHAKEMVGMMVSMYILDAFLHNPEEPEIKDILEHYTIAVIPEPTPDGLEFTHAGGFARSVNRVTPPRKNLPSGVYPTDLDGDGSIRFMRRENPNGAWKKSPEDCRLMIPREEYDVAGEFYDVCTEGMMNGSPSLGMFDMPDPYGNDFNRSFPYVWKSADVQNGAGRYPMENPEVQAIVNLLLAKKNICAFLVYHTATGCTFYPPASLSPEDAPKPDMQRYIDMCNMIKDQIGFDYSNLNDMSVRDKRPGYGSFDDYAYLARGVFAYAIELWDFATQADTPIIWKRPKNQSHAECNARETQVLDWLQNASKENLFKPWTPFEHPQFGGVEIGGLDTVQSMLNPPKDLMMKEIERAYACQLRQILMLPRMEIANTKAHLREDGLYEISADVINRGFFPTYGTVKAKMNRVVGPDMASLTGEGVEVIGDPGVKPIDFTEGRSVTKAVCDNGKYMTFGAGRNVQHLSWVIRNDNAKCVTVRVSSERGGTATAQIEME